MWFVWFAVQFDSACGALSRSEPPRRLQRRRVALADEHGGPALQLRFAAKRAVDQFVAGVGADAQGPQLTPKASQGAGGNSSNVLFLFLTLRLHWAMLRWGDRWRLTASVH